MEQRSFRDIARAQRDAEAERLAQAESEAARQADQRRNDPQHQEKVALRQRHVAEFIGIMNEHDVKTVSVESSDGISGWVAVESELNTSADTMADLYYPGIFVTTDGETFLCGRVRETDGGIVVSRWSGGLPTMTMKSDFADDRTYGQVAESLARRHFI